MSFRRGETLPRRCSEMSTNALDFSALYDDGEEVMSGIPFGSCNTMLHTTARQRDRRQAFADLLAALSRALDRRNDISLMRGAFEEMMRRVVPVRTVQLREAGSRWTHRLDASGSESFAVEVPGADPLNNGRCWANRFLHSTGLR